MMKGAKQLRNMIYNILENSDAVSGVTLKNSPNSSTLLLDRADGKGRMTFHTLFPGLTLAFIFVNAPVWPESDENSNLKPLLINYCVSGRSELLLDDGSYIYLKENDFCVSEQTAQKEYIFPTRQYQGIKIYFDLPLLLQSCGELLKSFSLDLSTLEENYCGNHKTYINGADSELENIFQKLWRLSEKPLPSICKSIRLNFSTGFLTWKSGLRKPAASTRKRRLKLQKGQCKFSLMIFASTFLYGRLQNAFRSVKPV